MNRLLLQAAPLAAMTVLHAGCLATERDPSGCGLAPIGATPCVCGPSLSESEASDREGEGVPVMGGTLLVRISSEPETLITSIEPSIEGNQVATHDVLETLLKYTPETKQVQPELATSFEVLDDGLRYIFQLRETAMWHDETPFTADDVVFTFDVLSDPAQVFVRRTDFSNVREVVALDTHTVSVKLDSAQDNFLESLELLPIIPAHVFGRSIIVSNPAARLPIGTGPLAIKKWITGRQIELVRNPHWDGPPIYVDGLIYKIVPDERVAKDLFAKGGIDISLGLGSFTSGPQDAPETSAVPLPLFEHWIFNAQSGFFNDARVRRAISLAIDRETIRCAVYGCRAKVLNHLWFTATEVVWPHKYHLSYNFPQSRKLLAAAGWRDSNSDGYLDKDGEPFVFTFIIPDNMPDAVRACSSIQYDLGALGILMKIRKLSPGIYYQRLVAGQFDAAQVTILGSLQADPWKLFHSGAVGRGMNYGGFASPNVDKLIDGYKNQLFQDFDDKFFDELELALAEEAPWVPMFQRSATISLKPEIKGWSVVGGRFDTRKLWLDDGQGSSQ